MPSNFDRIKVDLERLIEESADLVNAASYYAEPERFKVVAKEALGDKAEGFLKSLPKFGDVYEAWYSEALSVVSQLLPSRLADFRDQYEVPKTRKDLTAGSYRIHDMVQGLRRSDGSVGLSAGIPRVQTQVAVLKSAAKRFSSSLFDIRQIVQADLFDSEIDAARELLKNNYLRAAGAVSGVILERHLLQVCNDHGIKLSAKHPTISVINDALKEANVTDVPQWRFIQHLADIRNSCDHARNTEPKYQQVTDLIDGVDKVIKTLF